MKNLKDLKNTLPFQTGTWRRGVSLVIAAALVGLVLTIWGAQGTLGKHGWVWGYWVITTIGCCLVVVVIVRAIYAVFGQVPELADSGSRAGRGTKLRSRWRIAWAVGALVVATIAVTAITFAITDHIRKITPFCDAKTADDASASTGTTVVTTTTEPAAESPTDTTAPNPETTPTESSDPKEQNIEKEEFGVERGIRSHTFSVTAASADEAATLKPEDFVVYADDGHTETHFARVENVTALTNGDARVRLQIDLSCQSTLEGARHTIITVYHGEAQLDQSRWDLEMSLQSRLVFFALALVPVITILAMYQVFAMWPTSPKRWFTSLVAVGIPVLSAFTAAGLRNSTWSPQLLAIGTLIGTAYAAGITAANLVKNGGHDLETRPNPESSGAEVAAG